MGADRRRSPCARDADAARRWLDAARRTAGTPFRASRPSLGRDAIPPAGISGSGVVSDRAALRERAMAAAAQVVDPEIPVLSIVDLGVLRAVEVEGESVRLAITPTYSGCPAMRMIELSL